MLEGKEVLYSKTEFAETIYSKSNLSIFGGNFPQLATSTNPLRVFDSFWIRQYIPKREGTTQGSKLDGNVPASTCSSQRPVHSLGQSDL